MHPLALTLKICGFNGGDMNLAKMIQFFTLHTSQKSAKYGTLRSVNFIVIRKIIFLILNTIAEGANFI